MQAKIIFITGTDTGVGKTVLTALLFAHLRQNGFRAQAMKPFCSGDRADVELLHALQNGKLAWDEINPFYFSAPLAPLAAGRKAKRQVALEEALARILNLANRCQWLLVEGIGGACVPLGEHYLVADLIGRLRCETVVVSRNQLGTIHATLATCYSLLRVGVEPRWIALMEQAKPDLSAGTNGKILREWLSPVPVISIPYLGVDASEAGRINKNAKKIKKALAQILG